MAETIDNNLVIAEGCTNCMASASGHKQTSPCREESLSIDSTATAYTQWLLN